MVPQASSSAMSSQAVPEAVQRRQLVSQAAEQHTELPAAVGKHEPTPQSASASQVWPGERRHPESFRLQPSSPQSATSSQAPSKQR